MAKASGPARSLLKQTPIGYNGFVPDLKTGEIETTVLTSGGSGWIGAVIALIHVATWITAMVLINQWGNKRLSEIAVATATAKTLGDAYLWIILGILTLVLIHASTAKRDEYASTLASMLLLWSLAFENSLGVAYVSYALVLGDSQFYSAAMISQLFVSLGSSMIVAFYVNWSHRGNVGEFVLPWDRENRVAPSSEKPPADA